MHLLSTTIVEIDILSTVTVVVKSELQPDDIMGNDHVTINETTRLGMNPCSPPNTSLISASKSRTVVAELYKCVVILTVSLCQPPVQEMINE